MDIQQKVQAVLVASAALRALVPVAAIRARNIGQQNLGKTYVIHEPAGGSIPTHTHDGIKSFTHWPAYQVHCVGPGLPESRAIAAEVRRLLGDYTSAEFRSMYDGDNAPDIDDALRIVSIVLDFNIWENIDD